MPPPAEMLLRPDAFFDLTGDPHAALFADLERVWDALKRLSSYLAAGIGGSGRQIAGEVMAGAWLGPGDIVIGPGTVVEPGAYIAGPAWIGPNCVIRHGAYVRGQVILGEGCIVGHASEIKHSIMLPGAHAPHFNYIGDSILGRGVNLGAGTKLSNLTVVSVKDAATGRRPTLHISHEGETYDTGLTKLGAILGDEVQTGCNSVLNPGVLIGPHSLVYANLSLPKGIYPGHSLFKLRQTVVVDGRW